MPEREGNRPNFKHLVIHSNAFYTVQKKLNEEIVATEQRYHMVLKDKDSTDSSNLFQIPNQAQKKGQMDFYLCHRQNSIWPL